LEETTTHLICPICKDALVQKDAAFKCPKGHSFDIAKEGYVNLLVANKKNSKNPGDSKEMVKARREFLEKGYYDPLVDKMKAMIEDLGPEDITLLDSCSGEGYYTDKLASDPDLEVSDCYAYDISKPAIIAASKKFPDIDFCVAKVSNIPLAAETVDIIMTVFSPLSSSEFYRVLKEEGFVLVVSAGPNHLKELALMVYDKFKPHSYTPETQLDRYFKLVELQDMQFTLDLKDQSEILSLLKMTPYYWNTVKAKLENIAALESLPVTCDFKLSLFMKAGSADEEE